MIFIVIVNIVGGLIFGFISWAYFCSFETAFISSIFVMFSSYYKAKKQLIISLDNINLDNKFSEDSTNSNNANHINNLDNNCNEENISDNHHNNLPVKDRLFIGFGLSFDFLRIVAYGVLALSIVILVDKKLFVIIPFLFGVLFANVGFVLFLIKRRTFIL